MNKMQFSFMGYPAYNVSISQSMGDVSPVYGRFSELDPVTMCFQASYSNTLHQIISHHRGRLDNFVSTYPSGVCQHCGSYFPAGLLVCKNCGGYVTDEVVSTKSTRYQVLSISPDMILPGDDLALMDIEIALIDDPVNFANILSFEILPTGFNLNEGYILCNFCLCIVEASSICPNCGSARLPFSEVVKIDRECIFCHTKTYDGIMCKNCGASLAGVSYREYKGLQ